MDGWMLTSLGKISFTQNQIRKPKIWNYSGNANLIIYLSFHRVKILKEKALPEIENYMFEEHDQIRQAATECMCNLVCCKDVRNYCREHILLTKCCLFWKYWPDSLFWQVQDRYLQDGNDKLKLLILLCGEDDEQLQRAASGALAMLTAAQKKLAIKMTKVVCIIKQPSRLTVIDHYCGGTMVQCWYQMLIPKTIIFNFIYRLGSGLRFFRDYVSMTTLKFSTEVLWQCVTCWMLMNN